jgi:hypothetical protein
MQHHEKDQLKSLAEREVALAQAATDEATRRTHFAQAGIYFDRYYGGNEQSAEAA